MLPATRRGFLRTTLGSAWTAGALLEQSVLRASAARGQAATAPTGLFVIEKMAEGIYGAVAQRAAIVNCNAVIFENENDLLVVDTHSKPSAAASLLRQIRDQITKKPVRYLVNSHFHYDHVQGNPAIRRDSPGVRIISSESTRRFMVSGEGAGLKLSISSAESALATYRQRLAQAKDDANLQRLVADTESFLKEMKDYSPELPDITFQDDLTIHDKAHDLRLVFRGRGHTEGDVSVFCPQKRVLATGDLVSASLPYIGDGYPLDWPKTLDALATLPFDTFLGGHGGVLHGKQQITRMRHYLAEIGERIQAGLREGKSAETLVKELTPATLKSLQGEAREALLKVYSEGGRDGAAALAATVAGNVAQAAARISSARG